VIVEGYEAEPYLRFDARGVWLNRRSPAAYLNLDRHATVKLPPGADPRLPPEWSRVTGSHAYAWFDHRIHWMAAQPPLGVQQHPLTAQKVLDWVVPLVVGGKVHRLVGRLDYVPLRGSSGWPVAWIVGGFAVFAAAAAGAAFALLRRRPLA
jgi:hypothetical protein